MLRDRYWYNQHLMAIREGENMARIQAAMNCYQPKEKHHHHHAHTPPSGQAVVANSVVMDEPAESKYVYIETPVTILREPEPPVPTLVKETPVNSPSQYNSWLLTLLLMISSGFGALAMIVIVTIGVVLATALFGGGAAPTAIP